MGGSGFLAVYVSGIVLGNTNYVHKRSLTVFHDGLAWLMQIVMFLTMGLLVLPSEISRVAVSGVLLSAFLVFVARPASVLLCLTPFRYSLREQLMVSWAGLRGAVPIVVATYPLMAGASDARPIFNLVFFVVFISVLLQGTSVPLVSKWLSVAAPLVTPFRYPIEFNPTTDLKNELVEVPVPDGSAVVGRSLVQLALPAGALIVLIRRRDDVMVPRGSTQIEAGDTLLVLAEPDALDRIRATVSAPRAAAESITPTRYHGTLMTTMSSSPRTRSSAFSMAARLLCSRWWYQRRAMSSGMSTAIWRSGMRALHLEDVVDERIEDVTVRRRDRHQLRRSAGARPRSAPRRTPAIASSGRSSVRSPARTCTTRMSGDSLSANRRPFCDILFHWLIGMITIGGWMFVTFERQRVRDLDRDGVVVPRAPCRTPPAAPGSAAS